MWWRLKLLQETDDKIVYAYSRESNALDGVIAYNKSTDEITCEQYASGDNEKQLTRFLPHFYRLLLQNPLPTEKQIAIG